jgi:hypothetical protein
VCHEGEHEFYLDACGKLSKYIMHGSNVIGFYFRKK